jgi:hypothetical protein
LALRGAKYVDWKRKTKMRKSEQICARVTPAAMATLRALADKHSMLLSEFIRRTLAEKVRTLTTAEAGNEGLRVDRQTDVSFRT